MNERKGKKEERGRQGRERERKRRKCLQGKLLKKVQAGWLGSSSKGVGSPCLPAPKWQLLAPPLNTQCLVAKLCLSLTDEWGKARQGTREEGTQNAAIRSLFLRWKKKT